MKIASGKFQGLMQAIAPRAVPAPSSRSASDGIAEVREAVDFLRYYADEAERLDDESPGMPCGIFVCISPWNFPLAIFSGQIAAALAAGNAVLAKPAEQTPVIAARAVALMREAGLPVAALQLLPGDGPTVGTPARHGTKCLWNAGCRASSDELCRSPHP